MGIACDNNEYSIYAMTVVLSLIFTISIGIFMEFNRVRFVSEPERGRNILCTCGITKIIIGALLLTVLYPEDCGNFEPPCGLVVIVVGCFWIRRGMALSTVSGNPGPIPKGLSQV